jgi:hypothetical protein
MAAEKLLDHPIELSAIALLQARAPLLIPRTSVCTDL